MTPNGRRRCPTNNLRTSNLIPLPLLLIDNTRTYSRNPYNGPMMTRRSTRRYVPRPPHPSCTKRSSIWNNFIYYFRSSFLPRIFLSFLPLKPSTHPWTRRVLTTNGNHRPWSIRSPSSKHSGPPCFRCDSNMSPPQHYRRKTKTSNSIPGSNHPSRGLLYLPSSHGILRSSLYYRRWSIWFYLLCRNRLPRPPRYYWLHLPSCLLYAPAPPPLYIRPSLWIWSSRLILTFCRRCLTLPLRINLLMRLIIFLVLSSISDFQSPGLG